MADTLLLGAATLTVLVAVAHSFLGERYILRRLVRRELPYLFGSDVFTKRTLRFAWHLTTIAWVGFAVILVVLGARPRVDPVAWIAAVVAATFAVSSVVAFVGSRGRHLGWVVFAAISLLVGVEAW